MLALRPRAAYRYTLEDSVYVSPDAKGKGVGRAVLSAVIEACEARGIRQLMAVIGDSGNSGSVGLHRALGFEQTGIGRRASASGKNGFSAGSTSSTCRRRSTAATAACPTAAA